MKKVVLIGTPKFVIPFFERILNSIEFKVISVITRASKEKNGKKLDSSPIAIWGKKNQLNVLETKNINKDTRVEEVLKEADCALVFAFGQIISEKVLSTPKNGFFNIHPSRLPDLRGPSPLQTAIIRGDKKTALTLIKMNSKMDEGAIISQKEFILNKNHKILTIFNELGLWAPEWVLNELLKFLKKPKFREQNSQEATYCSLVKKEDFFISDEKPEDILNKIRALGYVFLEYDKVKLKCFLAKKYDQKTDVLNINGIFPIFVQQPGKKVMHIKSFLNGSKNKKNLKT